MLASCLTVTWPTARRLIFTRYSSPRVPHCHLKLVVTSPYLPGRNYKYHLNLVGSVGHYSREDRLTFWPESLRQTFSKGLPKRWEGLIEEVYELSRPINQSGVVASSTTPSASAPGPSTATPRTHVSKLYRSLRGVIMIYSDYNTYCDAPGTVTGR
jgi:hypothetical protein